MAKYSTILMLFDPALIKKSLSVSCGDFFFYHVDLQSKLHVFLSYIN